MYEVPILLLAFNRVETTQKVFDNIKILKPKYLFVGVDGPRFHIKGEDEKCINVQNIFLNQIDWDCELKTLFREQNLGCRTAVSQAISWFFSEVQEGVILEDDCIPDQSFFRFCEILLEKYREDDRVMHISGYKPHGMNIELDKTYSYFYSKQAIVWGWATWSTAWKNMDVNMKAFPSFKKENRIKDYIDDQGIQMYMLEKWDETYKKLNSSWAYAWSFCIENLNGITIIPNKNLILNIGYGEDATNTKVDELDRSSNNTNEMIFPLTHPENLSGISKNNKNNLEKEIFYKIQKSKSGVLIRRFVPKPILSGIKFLGVYIVYGREFFKSVFLTGLVFTANFNNLSNFF